MFQPLEPLEPLEPLLELGRGGTGSDSDLHAAQFLKQIPAAESSL